MKDSLDLTLLRPILQTPSDANELTSALNDLEQGFFKNKKKVSEILDTEIPLQVSNILKKLFTAHEANINEATEIQAFLGKLKEAINHLPHLSLVISIPPTAALIEQISLWFTTQLNQLALVDIQIDRSLLAGAIIEYKGKYHDYSLKKQLTINTANKVAF